MSDDLIKSLGKVYADQKIIISNGGQESNLTNKNFTVLITNPFSRTAQPEEKKFIARVFVTNTDGTLSINWPNVNKVNLTYVLAVIYGDYDEKNNTFTHSSNELLKSWNGVLTFGKKSKNIQVDPNAEQDILGGVY